MNINLSTNTLVNWAYYELEYPHNFKFRNLTRTDKSCNYVCDFYPEDTLTFMF